MIQADHLDSLDAQQLRELAAGLLGQLHEQEALVANHTRELRYRQVRIEQGGADSFLD